MPARKSNLAARERCVAFAGGGSGGHLTPAIAIAEELRTLWPDLKLLFFISERLVDQQILDASGLNESASVILVRQAIQPGPSLKRRPLRFLRGVTASVRQCRRSLEQHGCGFVLGLGGFASVPAILASRRFRLPVALLETNTIPGRANRMLSRFADVTFSGFPMEQRFVDRWVSPLITTAVPLRRSFFQSTGDHVQQTIDVSAERPPAVDVRGSSANRSGNRAEKLLLVLGGSQGAQRLNELVVNAVRLPGVLPPDWEILHQTGADDVDRVRARYAECCGNVRVVPFIDDVCAAMKSASLVISRAGAVSLAEISAVGRASILIPLRNAADGHQLQNAVFCVSRDAALIVDEADSGAVDVLAGHVRRVCGSEQTRDSMAAAAAGLQQRDAAATIAKHILSQMVDRQPAFGADP
ncbi:MAG: UDP-N-acetylglucosamine--N-acetylmuramyl-(pentapeptide) pyrophosphoryl-undecaprenol N-acetylglucosamine transferase [Planctomycetaceae bacterium]